MPGDKERHMTLHEYLLERLPKPHRVGSSEYRTAYDFIMELAEQDEDHGPELVIEACTNLMDHVADFKSHVEDYLTRCRIEV
jgi:hypothetical protein